MRFVSARKRRPHICCQWTALGSAVTSTQPGKPINGLRHPAHGNMCGWYIWSGEMLSEDSDYFNVICYEHIVANAWDWVQYLALPEGWRFLAAPGYEDMWFDQALFEI